MKKLLSYLLLFLVVTCINACVNKGEMENVELTAFSAMGSCQNDPLLRMVSSPALDTLSWNELNGKYFVTIVVNWYCDLDTPVVNSQITLDTLSLSLSRTNSDAVPSCSCETPMTFEIKDTTSVNALRLQGTTWFINKN